MSVKPLRALPNKPASPVPIDVPLVGWICGYDPQQGLLVDFPQNQTQGPLPARWTMQLDGAAVEQAVKQKQPAVLVFADGDPLRPIVTGLVQPLQLIETAPLTSVRLVRQPSDAEPDTKLGAKPDMQVDAKVDGKRLTFEAAEEIVLRCGQACLILRKNGVVQLKGAYVLSHSSGVNRIRGGSVQIN